MKKVIGIIMGIIIGIIGVILSIVGFVLKAKGTTTLTIGSVDGPTSVFVAGKVGKNDSIYVLVTGIILLVVAGFICFKHKH